MSVTAERFSAGSKVAAVAALLGLASAEAAFGQRPPADGTPLTGKLIRERLSKDELQWFVTGMVEGMAYGRFRKDSLAAGARAEDGMKCIHRWYDNPRNYIVILDAFQQHHQHTPWVVLGALLKKECGE